MGITDHVHLILPQGCHPLVYGYILHGTHGEYSTGCVMPGSVPKMVKVSFWCQCHHACCSVQKTYLRLLTIGLALARANAQLQDSNIPPAGQVAAGDILSPSML